jgi:molybdopterin synthase sulfur carrier subunit
MDDIVHVRAFARFRELFGDNLEIRVAFPATVRSVVQELARMNPPAAREIIDGEGNLRKSVIVLVNRERITGTGREDHPVRPGDEVAFYPPVAGG